MKIWNFGRDASSHVKPLVRSLISEGSQQAALIAQSYWGPLLIASQTWTRLKVKDILRSLMTVETEKLIQNKKNMLWWRFDPVMKNENYKNFFSSKWNLRNFKFSQKSIEIVHWYWWECSKWANYSNPFHDLTRLRIKLCSFYF